mmetsp:Transcript_59845/g.133371  ORF Transcript_59845/g.133371 Transcript_59845/m.133371 type:complete len:209 (+) Transcript_59845:339-965(+)
MRRVNLAAASARCGSVVHVPPMRLEPAPPPCRKLFHSALPILGARTVPSYCSGKDARCWHVTSACGECEKNKLLACTAVPSTQPWSNQIAPSPRGSKLAFRRLLFDPCSDVRLVHGLVHEAIVRAHLNPRFEENHMRQLLHAVFELLVLILAAIHLDNPDPRFVGHLREVFIQKLELRVSESDESTASVGAFEFLPIKRLRANIVDLW